MRIVTSSDDKKCVISRDAADFNLDGISRWLTDLTCQLTGVKLEHHSNGLVGVNEDKINSTDCVCGLIY